MQINKKGGKDLKDGISFGVSLKVE